MRGLWKYTGLEAFRVQYRGAVASSLGWMECRMVWSRRFNECTLVSHPITPSTRVPSQRKGQLPCGTLFPRGSQPCALTSGLAITLRVTCCDDH
jgi:hypothetical protein